MLAELSQRILAELEEAGFENLTSIMNTVTVVSGDPKEPAENRTAFDELITNGFAQIAYENNALSKLESVSQQASLSATAEFEMKIKFDVAEGIWKWDRNFPRAYLRLTDAGRAKSRRILNERGYQWWLEGTRSNP